MAEKRLITLAPCLKGNAGSSFEPKLPAVEAAAAAAKTFCMTVSILEIWNPFWIIRSCKKIEKINGRWW
jgi:hypothetical protein